MEDNAPNHKIGTGSLEVKPQMQAVHDEMAKIDKSLDALKDKAGLVFDGLLAKLEKSAELMDRIVAKAAEVKTPEFKEPTHGESERRDAPRPAIPERNSPEAQQILDRAEQDRERQEMYQNIRDIRDNTNQLVLRQVEE